MAFLEIQFPVGIARGAAGGPGYNTTMVVVNSGAEKRNQNWSAPLGVWDVAHGVKSQAQMDALIAFFRVVKGRANGFRFKDWLDYQATIANGLLGAGVGTGLPTYQLVKRYSNAAGSEDRSITKPVAGTLTPYRNTVEVVAGSGAGQYAVDTTTGIVTFVADASSNASAITPGATTSVDLAADLGLIAGKKLYLSGFTGADAAEVNGLAHTINSVSGAGPYTFILATNTAGKTITVGSGVGKKYPQASDALTAAFQFDVPARFDTDRMSPRADTYNLSSWGQIPIVEIRV